MESASLITDYFRNTARDNPRPAVRWGKGQSLSWSDLHDEAQRLADHLRERCGVARGDCVAIGLERSAEFVIAAYAVLLAGGVYFPVDPGTPAARLASMLSTARCRIAFAGPAHAQAFTQAAAGLQLLAPVQIEQVCATERSPGSALPAVTLQPTDPAYLIFTSGSTGAPKGVLVNHRAFINRLEWHQAHSGITPKDVILQRTALTFDVSLWELFLPALSGASHYLLQPGWESFPRAIVAALASEQVSVVHFVPSLLKPVLQELQEQDGTPLLPALRRVYVSGESLPASLVDQFQDVFGTRCVLTNLYGPTEAAIDVTYHDCVEPGRSVIPIGQPLTGCKVYVVDPDSLALKADHEEGEIALAGICLADGYFNRSDLTDKAFRLHPQLGERIYLTGDLGWHEAGQGFFCNGRKDTQVKLRGLRIELGEIEHHLLSHAAIREAVVCVVEDDEQEQWLVAAIVAGTEPPDAQDLRRFLAAQVPAYMLPARYWQAATLPRSSSGKLDRKAVAAQLREQFFAEVAA